MKQINGYENYAITEEGEVYNISTGMQKKSIDNHSGKGYLYVDLYKDNKRKTI